MEVSQEEPQLPGPAVSLKQEMEMPESSGKGEEDVILKHSHEGRGARPCYRLRTPATLLRKVA